jgi:hypothetical protein
MTCPATLANKGRVPCVNASPHTPHRGCRFELTDQADRVHHDHESED